jgi:hypothetical protein
VNSLERIIAALGPIPDLPQLDWQSAFRDEALGCDAGIPDRVAVLSSLIFQYGRTW